MTFNRFAAAKLVALMAVMSFAGAAARADDKINTYEEGKRIINLCADLLISGNDGLSTLVQNGFDLTKKNKRWTYTKGNAGFFTTPFDKGIKLTTSSRAGGDGCSIEIRGISRQNGDRLYHQLQDAFIRAGFTVQTVKQRAYKFTAFVKGPVTIKFDGISTGSGATIDVWKVD